MKLTPLALAFTASITALAAQTTSTQIAPPPATSSPAPATAPAAAAKPTLKFNVRDYGAKGEDIATDTAAFQKALDAAKDAGGGEVVVPAGNYTIGSVVMSSNTTLRLEKDVFVIESPNADDFPVIQGKFEGATTSVRRSIIYAEKADHIAILGPGGFVPNAALNYTRNPRAPNVVETVECNDVLLENFSIQYPPPESGNRVVWCIHPMYCTNLVVRGLYIRSYRTNGDGIDLDSCANVLIENCDISAGDDGIAIKSGRGMEAVRIARPTENVIIRNCKLDSPNYAAIGFGTELSGGLRNILVANCTISGRQNGMFIKSRDGRGAILENVVIENCTVNNSPNIVGIDLVSKGIAGAEPVQGDVEKWTLARNIIIRNITVNNVRSLVEVQSPSGRQGISENRPMEGLTIANISGTTQRGISLTNIKNVSISGISATGYNPGELLTLTNVTGTGLDEASATGAAATAAAASSAPATTPVAQ